MPSKRRYGFFLIQKHAPTTIWQWVAGVWLWPYFKIGKSQFYGQGHSKPPRGYALRLTYTS